MKTICKFGFAALAAGAFWGVCLSATAQTPDIFTKHELPIPGAYFARKESQKPVTVAASKSGQGVKEKQQTTPKLEKKLAQSVHFTAFPDKGGARLKGDGSSKQPPLSRPPL